MTDSHHPPPDSDPLDPLDELASAHLDGRTSPDEATRVATDPEVGARVDRLAALRDTLRATAEDPVDADARDAAIAAAIAAFTAVDTAPGPAAQAAHATHAAHLVRPTRGRPRQRTLQLLGIAAAAVLLALTVPLLQRLGSDSRDDTASSSLTDTASTLAPAPEAGAASGGGEADPAGGASAFDAASSSDLGAYSNLDALQAAVRAQLARPAASTTAQAPAKATLRAEGEGTCSPVGEPGGAVVYVARATLDGQPVTVVVRADDTGGRRLLVLDAACARLSETRL